MLTLALLTWPKMWAHFFPKQTLSTILPIVLSVDVNTAKTNEMYNDPRPYHHHHVNLVFSSYYIHTPAYNRLHDKYWWENTDRKKKKRYNNTSILLEYNYWPHQLGNKYANEIKLLGIYFIEEMKNIFQFCLCINRLSNRPDTKDTTQHEKTQNGYIFLNFPKKQSFERILKKFWNFFFNLCSSNSW